MLGGQDPDKKLLTHTREVSEEILLENMGSVPVNLFEETSTKPSCVIFCMEAGRVP